MPHCSGPHTPLIRHWKSVKYKYIEFFVFDYDSLPISFQSGITFPLVALNKIGRCRRVMSLADSRKAKQD